MVVKFGGSSVATPQLMARVASRIAAFRNDGWQVAAVVSARGRTTDELLELARAVSPVERDAREVDQLLATGEVQSIALLSMALKAAGCPARSLTARQCGITAQGRHGRALVSSFDAGGVREALDEGAVAVVAGFQALDTKGDVMTLGRGGSDLTAIALAARLEARVCSIYTDVGGFYTADPRVVPEARKIDQLDAELCCELTHGGSGVLQARCVEMAARLGVPLYLASSFDEGEGSWVMKNVKEQAAVAALAHQTGWTEATFETDGPTARNLLASLDDRGVAPLDFSFSGQELKVWFWENETGQAVDAWQRWGLTPRLLVSNLGALSLVGPGLGNHPEIARQLTELLWSLNRFPRRLITSGNRITALLDGSGLDEALKAAHRQFIEEQ